MIKGVFASLLGNPQVVNVYLQVDCVLTSGVITVAGQASFRPGVQTPVAMFYYRCVGQGEGSPWCLHVEMHYIENNEMSRWVQTESEPNNELSRHMKNS